MMLPASRLTASAPNNRPTSISFRGRVNDDPDQDLRGFRVAEAELGGGADLLDGVGEAVDAVVFGGNVFIMGGGASSETLTLGSVKAVTLRWDAP